MRNALKISSAITSVPLFLFLAANVALAGWTCCPPQDCNPNGPYPCAQPVCTAPNGSACQSTETKNPGSCPANDAACKALECGAGTVSSQCSGGTDGPSQAKCTQAIYAVPIPANMTIGQNLDFYADAHQDVGNFVKMTATVTNVPTSTPAIASVITTSGPTCYSTNNNCRQGFRLTAKANGTALLRVTTQMKLCPACAVSGSCTGVRTINIGSVTPLMCKPGAACTSDTASYAVGSKVTCRMPALTTTELNGGVASYQVECKPFKGTTAQAVIAKSSANGVFASFPIATGVTGVNCSFRYCVTGTNAVTQCSLWGTK